MDSTKLVLLFPTASTTPAQALMPGVYDVAVTNPGGAVATLSTGVEVVPPPSLTSAVATASFSTGAATPVQLDGTGFRTGAVPSVTISPSGTPATVIPLTGVVVVSATRLTATVPAGTPEGTYDVTVTNPDGCSATIFRGLLLRELPLAPCTSTRASAGS